jgi:hypothetical protein
VTRVTGYIQDMPEHTHDELSPEELEQQQAELLPRREALSVIGPLPGTPGSDAATDLPKIAEGDAAVTQGE